MEMADPMRDRNRRRACAASCPLSLVAVRPERRPCLFQTPFRNDGPARLAKGSPKISAGGYLSMNAAAWLPRRTAPERHAALNRQTSGGNAAMIWHGRIQSKPLRVLVSEGSSTSAREAITILGLAGHHVEVCDPSLVVPCAILALRPEISPLPGIAERSGRLSRLRRAIAGHAAFRRAAADA